jgi:hypothetical protein
MASEPTQTTKSDAEQLLDAQLLLGMIERYRPGTVQEARDWFGNHLNDLYAKAKLDGAQLIREATPDRDTLNQPCTI